MQTAFPRCRDPEGWKTLYRAAILEKDKKNGSAAHFSSKGRCAGLRTGALLYAGHG